MYDGHPYKHPVEGTVQGVESITLDDAKAFYRARYTFDNLQIGLAGDFPDGFPERVREDFKKALPKGEAGSMALPDDFELRRGKGLEVTIVDRPAADATAISLGFPIDVTRADDDFYPLLVAGIYLGDHRSFNGVLMNELRGKRGLNYGDYSYVENFIQDGGSTFPVPNVPRRQQHFSIWIRPVAAPNAQFALRGALFYLRRLVEDGPAGHLAPTRREVRLVQSPRRGLSPPFLLSTPSPSTSICQLDRASSIHSMLRRSLEPGSITPSMLMAQSLSPSAASTATR